MSPDRKGTGSVAVGMVTTIFWIRGLFGLSVVP
jgi:hypothetical protein